MATEHARRVLLAPGYILHHRPYRDTSRILEVLVADHGRLTLFARGVRGPKPRFGGALQPFDLLLLSFQVGREAGQLTVDAAVWVDREGQKPIVIGAKGERLKRVGTSARLALNGLLGRRLHLNLWVKVRENWADNARALRELGLE